jgi:hypothetical protein
MMGFYVRFCVEDIVPIAIGIEPTTFPQNCGTL